jgi:hypothetical protein
MFDLKGISYGTYIWAPIAATFFWLATLLSLLLWWKVEVRHVISTPGPAFDLGNRIKAGLMALTSRRSSTFRIPVRAATSVRSC